MKLNYLQKNQCMNGSRIPNQSMNTLLLTAAFDHRAGKGRIGSRIGLGADALTFATDTDIEQLTRRAHEQQALDCLLVDEAQFLSVDQVWQLSVVVDQLNIPVMCYGLRTDFRGQLFPGSAVLLAVADTLREIRTICHCGRKATMVTRLTETGETVTDGAQIEIGGNDKYVSLCRVHWKEMTGLHK